MITTIKSNIQSWLKKQPSWVFTLYASLAAFLTYSFMYTFRKPFTVATFEDISLFKIDYKIWLVVCQVVGYTLSKFIGIKYIAELKPNERTFSIIILVLTAEIALFFFYLIPAPFNFVFMFLNGLPLGMIWGVVFSYLEGRKVTEMLGAGLCASFILASGISKSIGKWVMIHWHSGEFSMPFITGAIFIAPLIISAFLLDCIPPPGKSDIQSRTKRVPMNAFKRREFILHFFMGLVYLVVAYIFLTIIRELRDNFAVEIWSSLGFTNNPGIFTVSEIPVAFITLISLALIYIIRSNYKAFNLILFIVLAGFGIVILSTSLFTAGLVSGPVWMIGMGIGLYLGYIPFNAFLFERMIATFRYAGNTGFVIYVSDAFGYLGSMCVLLFKYSATQNISWISFFISLSFWMSLIGGALVILALLFFKRKYLMQQNNNKYEHTYNSGQSLLAADSGSIVNQ